MTRTTTQTRNPVSERQRVFSSPIALAFVRTVVTRRGVSEHDARKIYLDYINRSQPAPKRQQVAR